MTYAFFHRVGHTLVPTDQEANDMLLAHEEGRDIRVRLEGARNPLQHRLFFCLCKLTADNDPAYNGNVEACRHDLLKACKHVDYHINRDGSAEIIVKSIAFDKMSQAAFDPMFKAAVDIVCKWLGTAPDEIRAELDKMLADKRFDSHRR